MASSLLILSNSDSGLYDFRKEVLKALLEKGFRVAVSVPDTGYVDKIKALGCEYIPTSFERRGMNPVKDMKLMLFYRRLMKEYRPLAVLTYTIKPNIYGGLAARDREPLFGKCYGAGDYAGKRRASAENDYPYVQNRFEKAGCVFFQNKGNRDFMVQKKCASGKVRVIPGSGVNSTEHSGRRSIRRMKDKSVLCLLCA
ncbi:MAG: glycosyltransferase [Eisenbergiella sp.]